MSSDEEEIPDQGTAKAAEWLRAHNVGFDTPTFWLVAGLLNLYADEKSTTPGWISVKERMPEPETWVLVWNGKSIRTALRDVRSCTKPFWTNNVHSLKAVTYWCPLPAPPPDAPEKETP